MMPHAKEVAEVISEAFANFTAAKPIRTPSILTQIGSHMKTTDVLSADSFYIGLETRCELALPFSPGFEFEMAFVIQAGKEDPRSKFCLALQGGADFEMSKAWGMAEKPDKELLIAMGGTKFDLLPMHEFSPILEHGGQAKIGTTAFDATVDVDMKTKKTFMVGTEIDIGTMFAGLGEKISKGTMGDFEKVFNFFKAEHGAIDAEIGAGGMECWNTEHFE